jgi:uncharacterized membrane protein
MTNQPDRARSRTAEIAALGAVGVWFLLYAGRSLVGHFSLGTNGFDLSVFDYALWSINRGDHGFVPFFGHSIFSEHFMPVLYLVAPLHRLFPSPIMLLLLQLVAVAGAAILFLKVQRLWGLDAWLAAGLMLVFLLLRRTHSALAGYFYPEVFQVTLTFAMVLLWSSRAWLLWPCVVALLMTKEDASIYVAGFSLLALVMPIGSRRRASATLALSVMWFMLALFVAVPASREAEGLDPSNPILQARYGASDASGAGPASSELFDRLFSEKAAGTLANVLLSTGLLPIGGIAWMVPAVPGIVVNLVASPDSVQSGLIDHYAWPILPWLMLSASAGLVWLERRSRRLASAWLVLLLLATAADNPALQRVFVTRVAPEAGDVRAQLARVSGRTIWAQPNLIPHLPKMTDLFAIGGDYQPTSTPDLILLTTVGNLWPLSSEQVESLIEKYRGDLRYAEIESGPLYAFRLRASAERVRQP